MGYKIRHARLRRASITATLNRETSNPEPNWNFEQWTLKRPASVFRSHYMQQTSLPNGETRKLYVFGIGGRKFITDSALHIPHTAHDIKLSIHTQMVLLAPFGAIPLVRKKARSVDGDAPRIPNKVDSASAFGHAQHTRRKRYTWFLMLFF